MQELAAEDDLVAARTVMHGRQVAPFVTYGPDGRVAQVFASSGPAVVVRSALAG